MSFDWAVIWRNSDALLNGLGMMLWMTVLGFAIACVLGVILAGLQSSRSPLVSLPAIVWVGIVRAVPLIIVIFWLYYGAASKGFFVIDEMQTGVFALGIVGSGYMSEVYRSAFQAIDRGQNEAAMAIGLRGIERFVLVQFPQAFLTIIPPAVNVFVLLLKGATLVSLIGMRDMFYVARSVAANEFQPFELYSAAAVIVISVTIVVSLLAGLLERYLSSASRSARASRSGDMQLRTGNAQ